MRCNWMYVSKYYTDNTYKLKFIDGYSCTFKLEIQRVKVWKNWLQAIYLCKLTQQDN
jgi:hypothetical protein